MQQSSKVKKTHGQIATALKAEAKEQGKRTNDVYNQFFREVFLHELMRHNTGWVLKGGSNIYCRIPGARHTKDLDLYRCQDPTSSAKAADELVSVMDGHKVGPYTFRVSHSRRSTTTGRIDSERIDVTILYGIATQLLSFGIDVSGDLSVVGTVERLNVAASYAIRTEFLPHNFQVFSYPIASQIADKICAMYERHGDSPPGKTSTRYHDLYDVALMAKEVSVRAVELSMALKTQCQVRKMTLPKSLTIPDKHWLTQYPAKARNYGGYSRGLESLDEALRVAGLLIDPILSGELKVGEQRWDYTALRWR